MPTLSACFDSLRKGVERVMNRNDFLRMCQRVSMLPDGVKHTKKNVPKDLLVEYENHQYYPEYLEIRFDNGKVRMLRLFTS